MALTEDQLSPRTVSTIGITRSNFTIGLKNKSHAKTSYSSYCSSDI